MPTYGIHVNKHVITANRKHARRNPPISTKTKGRNVKGHRVDLLKDGQIVASVLHEPEHPLACGAVVWVETNLEVRVDGKAIRKRARIKQ